MTVEFPMSDLNLTSNKLLMSDLSESCIELAELCVARNGLDRAREHMARARDYLKHGPPTSAMCGAQVEIDKDYRQAVERYNSAVAEMKEKGVEAKVIDIEKLLP